MLRLLGRLPQTVMTEVSEKLRRVGDLQLLERWTQPTALNFAHAKLTIFPISPHNFADDGTFLRNLVDRARAQPKSFASESPRPSARKAQRAAACCCPWPWNREDRLRLWCESSNPG